MKRWLQILLTSCLLLGLGSSTAWAKKEKHCRQLFQSKKYIASAQCFVQVFRTIKMPQYKEHHIPILRDRFLRHAAIAYQYAAKQEIRLEQQGYYRAEAVKLLARSFQKGYCEASGRCRLNRSLADKLRKQIRYTKLLVVTDNPKASIVVEGFKVRHQSYFRFNQSLRPGRYTVTITNGKKRIVRQVNVVPGQNTTVALQRTQLKIIRKQVLVAKRIPPLVLTGYILGGVLVGVGAVMVLYSVAEQGEFNRKILDPTLNQKLSDAEFNEGFDRAQAIKVSGGIAGGIGILAVAGGIVYHVAFNKKSNKAQPIPNKTQRLGKTFRMEVSP